MATRRREDGFCGLGMFPLDFDRVVRCDRGERAEGSPFGRGKQADHADRHRQLHDRVAGGVLDDDPANVTLIDQLLDLLDQVTALQFDPLGWCRRLQTHAALSLIWGLKVPFAQD